jgi:hypothetical protein
MERRVKRTIKFGTGSDITDSTSMADCLEKLQAFSHHALDYEWTRLRALVHENPSQIFVVDTETGFSGLRDVHQIGVVNYEGTTILETTVNHGCTVAEYLERTSQGLGEGLVIMTCKAVCKSYGPPSQKTMAGLSPREILLILKAAGMNKSSLWIEHSLGQFDYRHIAAIAPPDLQDVLPEPQNVYSTLDLWRKIMPGLFSHKLSHIFKLLCPHDALVDHRHSVLPDAQMCLHLLKVVTERILRNE